MAKTSNENTGLSPAEYEALRNQLIEILSTPGGGPHVFTDLQKLLIEGLDNARKEAVKQAGETIICKKLMEMDSMIITAAIHNIQCASRNMCGVHFPLVKFARDILVEQKEDFAKLTNKGGKVKEPFDLSFLLSVDVSTGVSSGGSEAIPASDTISRKERITKMREDGMSIKQIAKEIGLSTTRVWNILHESRY